MKDISTLSSDSGLDVIQNFASIHALLMSIPEVPALRQDSVLAYRDVLNDFWRADCPYIGSDCSGSAREVLIQLLRNSALAEVGWMMQARKVTWEQAGSLQGMFLDAAQGRLSGVTTVIANEVVRLPLHVLQSPMEAAGSPAHAVWLIPRDGVIQAFSSEPALLQHISRRFHDAEKREALLAMMSQADQARVNESIQRGESLLFSLTPCQGNLVDKLVDDLLVEQKNSFHGLQDTLVQQGDSLQPFVERIRDLRGFPAAQARKTEQLLHDIRRQRTPDWLKFGDEQDRAQLAIRGELHQACLRTVDELVGSLRNHEAFAFAHVRKHLARHGIDLDPASVIVTVLHSVAVEGRVVEHPRQLTLAQLALNDSGGQHDSDMKIMVGEANQAAGLTADIVLGMVRDKDLRVSYPQLLKERYGDDEVIDALASLQVARLANSLLAAKMQGVIDSSLFNLLDEVRQPDASPQQHSIGAYFVNLDGDRYRLADLLVLSYRKEGRDTFLLYAPNSPQGQDWIKCHSEIQVIETVASWSGKQQGRAYLLGQAPYTTRASLLAFLERTASTPSAADLLKAVQLNRLVMNTWQDLALLMAFRQTVRIIDESHALSPEWYLGASGASRQQLARLDNEIAALTYAYNQVTQVPSFVDYARETLQRGFDRDPKRKHDPRRWDVDQFEMQVNGQWRNLVWVAMNGVERGTDVAGLSVGASIDTTQWDRGIVADLMARFLDTHDVPEDYARLLSKKFLDASAEHKASRAQLHLRILQRELDRARLQLSLDPEACKGINPASMVMKMDVPIDLGQVRGGAMPSGTSQSGIYHFQVKGEKVQGVYLFRDAVKRTYIDVLYTPHAPDGVWFRPVEEIGSAIEHGGLGPYLRDRLPYRHLPRFERFLDKLRDNGYRGDFTQSRVGPHQLVDSFRGEHDAIVLGILRDVDASTVSKAERFSAMLVERTFQVLGVLALPFPPARMALGTVKVLIHLYRAAEAYRYADRAQAAWHLLDAALGVGSLAGVSGKPQQQFLETLFKGPPPELAEKMITQFSDRLADELDGYLRSVTIAQKNDAPSHAWIQAS